MKQYNIYAGILGKVKYQYTSSYEDSDSAWDDAYLEACEEFDRQSGSNGVPSWNDIAGYCYESVNADSMDNFEIEEKCIDVRNNWIDYYVVLTEEDNIDQQDLIISDDCIS